MGKMTKAKAEYLAIIACGREIIRPHTTDAAAHVLAQLAEALRNG